MKIGKLVLLFTLFLLINLYGQGVGRGEFKVETINHISNEFNLTITTNEYSWNWINSTVVPVQNYSRNYVNNVESRNFDAPKSKNTIQSRSE